MNTLLATHEDLLVKYTDGMLSGEEEQRFHALLTSNPDFADEVRAIAHFDDFLDDSNASKHWENQADTMFLAEMQQNLAQVVVTSAAASVASAGAASATSTAASSIPAKSVIAGSILANVTASKVIVASLVCASLGTGLWQWNKHAEERQSVIGQNIQSSQTSQNLAAPSSAEQNQAAKPLANILSQNPENTRLSERSAVVSSEKKSSNQVEQEQTVAQTAPQPSAQVPAQTPVQEQETRSDASIHGASKLRETIEDYTQQLQAYEQRGEVTSAVIVQKRLGMILREAGQYEESAQYFTKALKGSQNLKLREVYGEILAEQAVLLRATGNTEKALQTLQEAVGILQETGASSLTKWKREVERWEKK